MIYNIRNAQETRYKWLNLKGGAKFCPRRGEAQNIPPNVKIGNMERKTIKNFSTIGARDKYLKNLRNVYPMINSLNPLEVFIMNETHWSTKINHKRAVNANCEIIPNVKTREFEVWSKMLIESNEFLSISYGNTKHARIINKLDDIAKNMHPGKYSKGIHKPKKGGRYCKVGVVVRQEYKNETKNLIKQLEEL
jgi:hypothetical protein